MIRMLMAFFGLVGFLSIGVAASASESLEQAIALFSTEQYTESQRLLEQALADHPDNATAHAYLGRIYLHTGDVDKAVTHCQRAVDIDATTAAHHFCLGRSYGEKARQAPFWMQAMLAPKIRKAFETTIALEPSHRSARVGLTHFYMRAPSVMGGSLAKAQEQAEQLIQLQDPRGEQLLQDIFKRQNKTPLSN